MNHKLSIAYLTLIIVPLFFGCGGPVKEENKNNASASSISLHVGNEKYVVIDTKESVVTWRGYNLNGLNSQTGYVYISKGELLIENGELMGGIVEVDMNTIEDKKHGRDNKLVNHLKDPDFFEVEKFPFSTIAITSVTSISGESKKVTGNLTIEGITKAVTFPANMYFKDGMDGTVEMNGTLVIDRTEWGINYGSLKLINQSVDGAISDDVKLFMKIVAKK